MWPFAGFLILSLVVAIALLFIKKMDANLHEGLSNLCWTFALVGGLLFFCRYTQIPYLGNDLIRLILELACVAWLVVIIIAARKALPAAKLQTKIEDRRTKYLPKPKA